MPSTPPVCLFDLDGTLVDTNYLHTTAWAEALRDAGHVVPTAWVHLRIGMGGDRLLTELIGPDGHEAVQDGWRERFRAARPQATAFEGAGALLRRLADLGARVVIASSSEQDDVDALVALLHADDAISAVTSSQDVGEAKPAPDIFQVALAKVGGEPANAVAIGDSVWDVEAARRAGVPCIGVLTGGIAGCELSAAGAASIARDPIELAASVDRGPLGLLLGSSGARHS